MTTTKDRHIQVRLDQDTYDALAEEARKQDRPMSYLARQFIVDALAPYADYRATPRKQIYF